MLRKIGLVMVALCFALLFSATKAMAQFDGGTNAVTQVSNNVGNATTVGTPVMLGLLGLGLAVGTIVWLIKKGRRG